MKRPILWTTIFMICGIYMRLGISKVICLVSFLFLLFFMFRFVINKKKPAYLLLLFFVPLGFFSAGVHWQAEQSLLTKTVTGEGVILEEGETTSGNQKLTLRCSLEKQEKPCKVYAVWVGEERFQEGERVAFSGEIVPFSKQSYPGGYDEQLYLLTKGYEYKLYPEKIKVTGQDTSLSVRLARARAGVQMVLDRILPAEESGLMQAVLTGDKEKIPEESYTLYSKAGVVHVLCISGLHLSILALYLAFFSGKGSGKEQTHLRACDDFCCVCLPAFYQILPVLLSRSIDDYGCASGQSVLSPAGCAEYHGDCGVPASAFSAAVSVSCRLSAFVSDSIRHLVWYRQNGAEEKEGQG